MGSQNGNVYIFDYQREELIYTLPVNFEYHGMQLVDVSNLSVPAFTWLKCCGADGLPIMNDGDIVKSALSLGSKVNASKESKAEFSTLKNLIEKQLKTNNEFVSFLQNIKLVSDQDENELALKFFVDKIDWPQYPEVVKMSNEFLRVFRGVGR